ncbi:hypothetical protein KL919_001352 [Ogataea angusta]|nr:hypothetical protein KL920_002692 [Ogataea angusta]KAG7862222.1 hypothetical protein KL919_001352 [Ogataea angusta]
MDSSLSDEVMEDVLPSFQMHNQLFNRTVLDPGDEIELPGYEETSCPYFARGLASEEQVSPLQNPDLLVLNNLKSLRKINAPVQITITFTNQSPLFGEPYESRPPLLCFYPGDVVNGLVTIENTGNGIIPFEMFFVSLDGVATIPQNGDSGTECTYQKHCFLKSFDLAACFHECDFQQLEKSPCTGKDPVDGAIFGLPNSRKLQPRTKYKKAFAFRLPSFLLDSACNHQYESHLQAPSSLGVNPFANNGRAAKAKISERLGYGCLDEQGAPIITQTFNEPGQSVSYSLNVHILARSEEIAKSVDEQKSYELPFVILEESSAFLRFTNTNNPVIDEAEDLQLQVDKIEHQAAELEVTLEEKCKLRRIGVTDQNVLESVVATDYIAKKKRGREQEDLDLSGIQKIKLNRGFLKGEAEFEVQVQCNGQIVLHSFEPASLGPERVTLHKTFSNDILSGPNSIHMFKKAASATILPSIKSGEVLISLKSLDGVLPKEIVVEPSLRVVNMHSRAHIPLHFGLKGTGRFYNYRTFVGINRRFEGWDAQLKTLCKELGQPLPRQLHEDILGLKYLRYREHRIDLFEPQRVQLNWRPAGPHHESKFTAAIFLDVKKAESFHIIPEFQTCFLARQYVLDLKIGKGGVLALPLTVY